MKAPNAASAAIRVATVSLVAVALATSCERSGKILADRVEVVSGQDQSDLPGVLLPDPLVVRVAGPRPRGLFARRGRRPAASGQTVVFRVERLAQFSDRPEAESAAAGGLPPFPSLLGAPEGLPGDNPRRLEVTTDSSGFARIWVRLGTAVGDWRVEAIVEYGEKAKENLKPPKVHFRLASGVERIAEVREAGTGDAVLLSLRLAEWAGPGEVRGLPKREIFFRVVGEPTGVREHAVLSNQREETDDDGVLRKPCELTLGDRSGVYHVLAEISPPDPPDSPADGAGATSAPAAAGAAARADRLVRGILYRIVAVDWFGLAIQIAGGILIYLVGIRLFTNGFLLLRGARLEASRGRARSRLGGYASGIMTGVTFESWSAVTSHLRSLTHGGVLTARNAFFPALGASLGATLLPQILALGVESLGVPLMALGLLLLLLPRRLGTHPASWVALGIGLVFTSWPILVEGFDLLSLSREVREVLLPEDVVYGRFSIQTPLAFLGVLATGAAAGFLLRTSNLIVVAAMLLCARGSLVPATAVALVVGANLGSAALLHVSTPSGSPEARRFTGCCLAYQGFTALLICLLSVPSVDGSSPFLKLVDALVPGAALQPIPENVAQHIAMVHTLHNAIGSLLFLIVPGLAIRVADRFLGRDPGGGDLEPSRLDGKLIPVPPLALRQATEEIVYLRDLAEKAVAEAFDAFRYSDLRLADQVVRRVETITSIHRDIARFLVLVAENELSRRDASRLEILQAAGVTMARIAECAERLREIAARRAQATAADAEDLDRDLDEAYDLLIAQFDNVGTLLRRRDPRVEENCLKQVERLAKFRTRLEAHWQQRLETGDDPEDGSRARLRLLLRHEVFEQIFRIAGFLAGVAESLRTLAPERL